jgi:hypothetical protein
VLEGGKKELQQLRQVSEGKRAQVNGSAMEKKTPVWEILVIDTEAMTSHVAETLEKLLE